MKFNVDLHTVILMTSRMIFCIWIYGKIFVKIQQFMAALFKPLLKKVKVQVNNRSHPSMPKMLAGSVG